MKKRLDENLHNDSIDDSLILGTKSRLVEEVEVDDTVETKADNWVLNPIFYDEDFKEEGMREFWEDEFEKAYYLNSKALKEWAKDMLDYLDDFVNEAVKEDIEETLHKIMEQGTLDVSIKEEKTCSIKEAESLSSKIHKQIEDAEADIEKKKEALYSEKDEDERERLFNEISDLELEIGEMESYLDEMDYMDSQGGTSWFESVEKHLDEKFDDVEVEWEVIWHPADWDMQAHDANIESFDDLEKYKARLDELKDSEEPVVIVSANSYNKDGEIIRMDLDMQNLDREWVDDEEDEFEESFGDEIVSVSNVGIDFSSLVSDDDHITGTCIIYGNEDGEETVDERKFIYDVGDGELEIIHKTENEVFDDKDFAKAENILKDNIETNIENIKQNTHVLKEDEEEKVEVEVKETETSSNPLDELPDVIEPIFEFESGNYVYIGWDANSKSLIAGGATNTGIIPEFELKYDFDRSLDDNLDDLWDKIIAEHPEYLEPVDGGEGEGEEIEAEVEVEEESLQESDKPAATSMEDCQKWVDYDMKHYGKISDNTNNIVRKAGFQIIKDDHGDYEVAAGKFESVDKSSECVQDSAEKEDKEVEDKKLGFTEEENAALERLKSKYPSAYVPEYDKETGLPILPDEIADDWKY